MSKSRNNGLSNDLGIFKANEDLKDLLKDSTLDIDPAFFNEEIEEDIIEELDEDDDESDYYLEEDLTEELFYTNELTEEDVTEILELTKDLGKLMIGNIELDLNTKEELELTQKIENIEKTKEITFELLELTREVQKIKEENNIQDITNKEELKKIEKKQLLTLMDLVENANKSIEERQTIDLQKFKKQPRKVSRKEFDKLPTKNGQKVKQVLRKDRVVWTAIFFISVIALAVLIIRLVFWEIENRSTAKQIDSINSAVVLEEMLAAGPVLNIPEDVEQPNGQQEEVEDVVVYEEKRNDYWYYISQSMLDVNFDELKSINSDVRGWIQVNGTNINYPFVQAADNDYYLKRSFDKSSNSAGWVFMDYRNSHDEFDKNNILYAHGRLDRTMFGSLVYALNPNWYNNVSNHVIKVSTEDSSSLWKVFSVYTIKAEGYYIKTNFSSDSDFEDFIHTLKNRSIHDFGTEVSKDDKVLTLSTCYDNNGIRMVLHAKLIKLEEK